MNFRGIFLTSLLIAASSCEKPNPQEEAPYARPDPVPETITLDLAFYNSDSLNPLGFAEPSKESPDGEEYPFIAGSDTFRFVVCKGQQKDAQYLFTDLSLVYPAGERGRCLLFEKSHGWVRFPAIEGYTLQSVTYEHGNAYTKQAVLKESLNPSVTIAYTSSQTHQVATSVGPSSETISFYSNGFSDENILSNPKPSTPYYLQFVGTGTRLYRLKLVYASFLPSTPNFPQSAGTFPKVIVTTAQGAVIDSKEEYVEGTFTYQDPKRVNPGIYAFADSARFRGRGNSTWGKPKKPYKVKLDSKASFFNLPKDREWCLLANYCDKSLLRNSVAMQISRILGFDWTPQMYPVELWLNGSYQGLYTLSEHKKVSPGRVNINTDARQMYLETDLLMNEPVCFKTGMGVPVMYIEPDYPDSAMLAETRAWLDSLENALTSGKGYESYIDVPSFVNHYIIQELSKNVDGRMTKGAFMTRAEGDPLKICHEWDFDIAFGNANTIQTLGHGADNGPEGFLIKDFTGSSFGQGWYPLLFNDPAFVSKVKRRWNDVYPELQTIPSYIDRQAEKLSEPSGRNFSRWPILGKYIWPNTSWPATYAGEVANLKDFYSRRLEWLNTNLNSL